MLWSTLRVIVNSKAYWSLNILFFLVPLFSRFKFPIDLEVFGLYIAAWLLLVGGLLFSVTKPELLDYENFTEFASSGRDTRYLKTMFQRAGGFIEQINDNNIRERLTNKTNNLVVNPSVFWEVFQQVDSSRRVWRMTIVICMLLAASLLIAVNIARFAQVSISAFGFEKEFMMAIQKLPFQFGPIGIHMSIGGNVDVTHESGNASTMQTSGKLIDSDDNGYIVIETDNDKLVYIPKNKVITVIRDVPKSP